MLFVLGINTPLMPSSDNYQPFPQQMLYTFLKHQHIKWKGAFKMQFFILLVVPCHQVLPSYGNPSRIFKVCEMFREWLAITTPTKFPWPSWGLKSGHRVFSPTFYPLHHTAPPFTHSMRNKPLWASESTRITLHYQNHICLVLFLLA